MPWKTSKKTEDPEDASDSLFAANDVISPLSTSSSRSRTRTSHRDIESGKPSVRHKSVSFDDDNTHPHWKRDNAASDPNVSPSMLAAAAAAGAAAAAAIQGKDGPETKASPSSIHTSPTMTSEDSYNPPSASSGGPTVVTLEHRVKQKKGNKLLKFLLKPSVLAAGGLFLLMTGGTAFFFTRWLSIPGLNEQIERLQEEVNGLTLQVDELEAQVDRLGDEVDRLGYEVDRLSDENDRFAELNKELEANVAAFAHENERLNASLEEYEDLNSQLGESVEQLHLINEFLKDQNNQLNATTLDLNATTTQLEVQIDRLETLAGNLTESNRELRELNEDISTEITRFEDLTEDLKETVASLGDEVDALSIENTRLASLNSDLTLVVSFLNETAVGLQGTYKEITDFMLEQITAYNVLALQTLQNLYMQRISRYDCDYQSYFLTEPFATDRSLPIGESKLPKVLEYIDERVLSELCLDASDFERRLQVELPFSPGQVTTNQLVRITSSYTSDALNYYFPDDESAGLTGQEWSDAGFDCEKLPVDQRYVSSY